MKKEKCFFSFSCYDHYAMLKREKRFVQLVTMFSKEGRKMFFFSYWLRSLGHDQERTFFFHLASNITTLWPRVKKVFFSLSYCNHYAMITRKKLFFSFRYYDHYAMIKRQKSVFHSATLSNNEERKILFFIYSLWSLCHDQEWKFSFQLATIITTLWSREKKVFFI